MTSLDKGHGHEHPEEDFDVKPSKDPKRGGTPAAA